MASSPHHLAANALQLHALLLARQYVLDRTPNAQPHARAMCARLAKLWQGQDELERLASAVVSSSTEGIYMALDDVVSQVRRERGENRGSGSILIVDDDRSIRSIIEMIARPFSRTIHTVGGVADALALIAVEPISVVVLDIGLPDGDGRDLLIQLRRDPITASVPVLVLTGSADPLVVAECLALGAQEVHSKPVDPIGLSSAVSIMLGFEARTSLQLAGDMVTGLSDPAVLRQLATTCAEGYCETQRLWCVVAASTGSSDRAIREVADAIRPEVEALDGVACRDGNRVMMVLPNTTASEAEALCRRVAVGLDTDAAFGISETGNAAFDEAAMIAKRIGLLAAQMGGVASSEAPQPTSRRSCVVVVDDDPVVASLIRAALNADGLEVVHLSTGERMIEVCRKVRPVTLVLDVDLPGDDGLALLTRLRATEGLKRTPVLLLTAHGESRYVEEAFKLGADDFVAKPFDVRDVHARLRRLRTRDNKR